MAREWRLGLLVVVGAMLAGCVDESAAPPPGLSIVIGPHLLDGDIVIPMNRVGGVPIVVTNQNPDAVWVEATSSDDDEVQVVWPGAAPGPVTIPRHSSRLAAVVYQMQEGSQGSAMISLELVIRSGQDIERVATAISVLDGGLSPAFRPGGVFTALIVPLSAEGAPVVQQDFDGGDTRYFLYEDQTGEQPAGSKDRCEELLPPSLNAAILEGSVYGDSVVPVAAPTAEGGAPVLYHVKVLEYRSPREGDELPDPNGGCFSVPSIDRR